MSFIKSSTYTKDSPPEETIVTLNGKDYISAKGIFKTSAILTAIGSAKTLADFIKAADFAQWVSFKYFTSDGVSILNDNALLTLLRWADPSKFAAVQNPLIPAFKACRLRQGMLTTYRDDYFQEPAESPLKYGYFDYGLDYLGGGYLPAKK